MSKFSASAWFWKADDGRIYNSATNAVVTKDDSGYIAFSTAGNVATVWPRDPTSGAQTTESLTEALAFYGVVVGEPAVAQLIAEVDAQAKAACDYVTGQVLTAETHVAGYTNAAAWAIAAGGVPTVDPGKTAFANMATANGLNEANFTTLVLALSASSMVLSATLTTLQAAAAAATTAAQLATALTAFEASLTAEVSAINAAGVTVKAPATISIVGVNA